MIITIEWGVLGKIQRLAASLIFVFMFNVSQSSNPSPKLLPGTQTYSLFPPIDSTTTTTTIGITRATFSIIKYPPNGIYLSFRDMVIHNQELPLEIWKKDENIKKKLENLSKGIEPFKYLHICVVGGAVQVSSNWNDKFTLILVKKAGTFQEIKIEPSKKPTKTNRIGVGDEILFFPYVYQLKKSAIDLLVQEKGFHEAASQLPIGSHSNIKIVRLTICKPENSLSSLMSQFMTERILRGQKWFRNSASYLLTPAVPLPPYSLRKESTFTLNYSGLPLSSYGSRLKIENQHFELYVTLTSLTIQDTLENDQSQSQPPHKSFIKVCLKDSYMVNVEISGSPPFLFYTYYRKEKKWESWWKDCTKSFDIQDYGNIYFVLYPLGLFLNHGFQNKFPAINPHLSFKPPNQADIREFGAKVSMGMVPIIFKVLPPEIPKVHLPTYFYSFPLIKPTSTSKLRLTNLGWIATGLEFPSSIIFHSNLILFGEAISDQPAQFYPPEEFPNISNVTSNKTKDFILCKLTENIKSNDGSGLLEIHFHGKSKNTQYLVVVEGKQGRSLRGLYNKMTALSIKVSKGEEIEIYYLKENFTKEELWKAIKESSLSSNQQEILEYLSDVPIPALNFKIDTDNTSDKMGSEARQLINATILIEYWLLSTLEKFDVFLRQPSPHGSNQQLKLNNNDNERGELRFSWVKEPFDYSYIMMRYPRINLVIGEKIIALSSQKPEDETPVSPLECESAAIAQILGDRIRIIIRGKIPFTFAYYRSGTLAVSWSGEKDLLFDDIEPGGHLTMIPWTAFYKNEKPSLDIPETLEDLFDGFKEGFFKSGYILTAVITRELLEISLL